MQVDRARAVAEAWVREHGESLLGFKGALLHGSILERADDAELAATSDLDLLVVLDDPDAIRKPGKFRYRGVLLEVSVIAFDAVNAPATVLGTYNLAPSFRANSVLADPTGVLATVQAEVARHFADPEWIDARIAQAAEKVRSGFAVEPGAPLHAQVTSWLFATGVLCHVVLVGALRNPTVRTRYVATRAVLAEYGRLDDYERLLELLGCAQWSAERTRAHLDALVPLFEAAASVIRSPFFFAADISADGRAVAIDGSRELIDAGLHREAVFWIVATWCRCLAVLEADGTPEQRAVFEPRFRALLADLGIASEDDLARRREATVSALEWVEPLAREIAGI